MKLIPQKVISMTLFLFVFTIIFSCSKDTDLLLESVLNDPEISVEEKERLAEEVSVDGLVTRTFTFSPTDDAYLQNEQGHDQSIIRLQEDYRTSYLMFDLSDVNGKITDAVLQFSIDSDEGDGSISVHKGISANWTEENLTINNAPGLETQLGSINKTYKVGSSEKVPLNADMLGAEATTFVMTHSTGNDLAFASKEHPANKGPKLVITYLAPEGSPFIEQQEEDNQNNTQEDNSNTNEDNSNTQEDNSNTQDDNSQEDEQSNNNTASTQGAYYVTTSGSPSNDGLSEATAWSIEYAFETAVAGDVVYIKAGDYGNKQLVVDNSGNTNNPIKFIGYTNSPGDLVSHQGSTFNYGESLNAAKMPLIRGANSGTGIFVPENNIEIENFQITKFGIGVISNGLNVVLKNIIIADQGNQSNYDAYDGFGFQIKGNNSLLENCSVLNMTAEAIRLYDSDNSRVNYCSVYADNPSNPTDYYYLLAGGTNNSVVENSYAERQPSLRHGGHGFDLKDLAENNIIRNCTAVRTNFELNFSGVKNNTIIDCNIYGVDTSPANWHAGLVIFNGANNNLIKNMYIQDTWSAISWADDDDGYVGPGGDRDEISMGYDNTFDNITIKNTNRILNSGGGTQFNAWAKRNTFKNCNFSNFTTAVSSYYPTEDIKFENCNFTNGQYLVSEAQGQYAPYSSFDVSWINCSWTNVSFPPPN